MDGLQQGEAGPIVFGSGSVLALEIDVSIYESSAIFRAAYKFTDRCYIFLARAEEASFLIVTFRAKKEGQDLSDLIGLFCNELIDQQIRQELAREAGPVREIIVAQAFAEGNLLDSLRDEGSYEEDPLGIGQPR
ncbi:MAG TPA: His-Xaa-Ser system protein HxsD [Nitrospira sp.]|nr:His-Xaa-Ser system protein HxsD [Nitrospira sp.]